MFHQGQRLPFGFESSHHLAGVHARLEHFQGDFAAHRPFLLGHEDDPESPFADLFQQFVRPDNAAGPLAYSQVDGRASGGLGDTGRRFQEAPILFMHPQQGLDSSAQPCVAAAYLVEIAVAGLQRFDLPRDMEDEFFVEVLSRHAYPFRQRGSLTDSAKMARRLPRENGIFWLGFLELRAMIRSNWPAHRPFPGVARRGRKPNHCRRLTAKCPGPGRPLRWSALQKSAA